ncbi:MAG: aspartate aminotransferase family protein [Candidatus Eiseniibacteriota bacterium]
MDSTHTLAASELAASQRLVLARAEGLHVWDRGGHRYLDATSGAFCVQLGYTRPDLVQAMTEAASRLPYARPSQFESEDGEAYREALLRAAGPPYTHVILTSSGSEAVDVALKIAHRYQIATGPGPVKHLSGHFHGATLGALGATGVRARRDPFATLVAGPGHGPEAAMILETIPAAGLGAPVPPPGYLATVRTRCDEGGALWIADEVLTGFGRTGALFAWQRLAERRAMDGPTPDRDAKPDLIVFGKGAGAGFAALAGVIVAESVALLLEADNFAHFQTYGGNPIACSVGRRVLEALAEEKIYERVRETEVDLERALRPLLELPAVSDVRGIGYLWGIELAEDRESGRPFARERRVAERIADACREHGVLVHAGSGCFDGERGDFILIAPPLVTTKGSFDTIVDTLAEAIPLVIE